MSFNFMAAVHICSDNKKLKSSKKISQTLSTLEPAPQGPAYEEEPDGATVNTVPASKPLWQGQSPERPPGLC